MWGGGRKVCGSPNTTKADEMVLYELILDIRKTRAAQTLIYRGSGKGEERHTGRREEEEGRT